MPFPLAFGFIVAIFVSKRDYNAPGLSGGAAAPAVIDATRPAYQAPRASGVQLGVACISGPLKGQNYRIGPDGVLIGRDYDCTIRFPAQPAGLSRHHCRISYQQGQLMLTDLTSAYGTFFADGRKLPPQYPAALSVGSRFYLGNPDLLFEITAN